MTELVDAQYEGAAVTKLMRAKEQFLDLELAIAEWNRCNEVLLPVWRSADLARSVVIYAPTEPCPPLDLWSSRFGEGVHSLRSALDTFAWEVCHLDGRTPSKPKRVYFPANVSREGWPGVRKALSSMPADILERLLAVQAWSGEPAHVYGESLAMLHAMDLQDKHRALFSLQALPGVLDFDKLRDYPEGQELRRPSRDPLMRVSIDRDINASSALGLLEAPLLPVVTFEGRAERIPAVQRWLLRETYRVLGFVASGQLLSTQQEEDFCGDYSFPDEHPAWLEIPGTSD